MKRHSLLFALPVLLISATLFAADSGSGSGTTNTGKTNSNSSPSALSVSASSASSAKAASATASASTSPAPLSATANAQTTSKTAASAVSTTANNETQTENPGHKQVWIADTLAIFPGIVVHGAGNMYAGNWTKGLGLFVIGSAGAALVAYEAVQGSSVIQNEFSQVSGNGQIPDDISNVSDKIGIIIVGTMAFIWTGWDDMAGSGMAVERYNKQLDEENSGRMSLVPANGGGALLSYNKRF